MWSLCFAQVLLPRTSSWPRWWCPAAWSKLWCCSLFAKPRECDFQMKYYHCFNLGPEHVFFCVMTSKVPNRVRLDRERLPVRQLADFRQRYKAKSKYTLAAHLWSAGQMEWAEALKVATDAFEDVPIWLCQKCRLLLLLVSSLCFTNQAVFRCLKFELAISDIQLKTV